MLVWSCSKDINSGNTSLKDELTQASVKLDNAMKAISASDAYSILTVNPVITKSVSTDTVYKVYITLDSIKGKYDYKPVKSFGPWFVCD